MFNPEKIIAKAEIGAKRYLSLEESDELDESIARINRPLHSDEYKEGIDLTLTLHYEDTELKLSYRDLTEEELSDIEKIKNYLADTTDNSPSLDSKNWKRLSRLILEQPETDSFDITKSIPENFPVYFCPKNILGKPGAFVCSKPLGPVSGIFYNGDVGTIAGIAILLHEIGHLHTDFSVTEEVQTEASTHPSAKQAAINLQERYANAFALKHLRSHITSKQDREDVLIMLRHYGQGSYDSVLWREHLNKTYETLRNKIINREISSAEEKDSIYDQMEEIKEALGRHLQINDEEGG